jgi:NitT/TauT family transport system ATP-binding protein
MAGENSICLTAANVTKSFFAGGREIQALSGVSLKIDQGGFIALIGPSGSGKSTLLQMMAGLMSPTSGELSYKGKKISGPPPEILYVFQQYTRSLFPWKTVTGNVSFGLQHQAGVSNEEVRRRVGELIELVGLAGFEHHYPWQLSGGMQQRVAIARALACRPQVLLMDEPFSAVDALTRVGLQELVRSLWQELGITIVLVTHDVDEGIYMSTRAVVLSRPPATIAIDIPIDLPTPRNQIKTRAEPKYLEYRAKLLGQLFGEVGLDGMK